MKEQNNLQGHSEDQDIASPPEQAKCGTLMLWIARDKKKQKRLKDRQRYLAEGCPDSKQSANME